MTQQSAPRTGTKALLGLCFAAGLAGLSVSIIRPILVDIAHTYSISVALSGQLVTIAAVAGMLGNLGLSPLMDRVGRREAIVAVLATMALFSGVCTFASSFVALCAAYSVVGMCAYLLLALAIAGAGDLYEGPGLGRALGWIAAGMQHCNHDNDIAFDGEVDCVRKAPEKRAPDAAA